MYRQEAKEEYLRALKLGQKEQKERDAKLLYPYPTVLDQLLPDNGTEATVEVGIVEIPANRIVGTKSAGRITAFSSSFLPLLEVNTEFAHKWIELCAAHLSEGIRDPIFCFEYLGEFYVQEGNKRVSVLRSFGATRITGTVRRLLPRKTDEPHIQAYYEFLEFYKGARTYDVRFRRPGDYGKLLSALGKEFGEEWDQWERRTFSAYLQYFREAFYDLGGEALSITPEEALLLWLDVYSFRDLGRLNASELKHVLGSMWDTICSNEENVQVRTVQTEEGGGLLSWFLTSTPDHLNVAFVHLLDPDISPWIRSHDSGRKYVEQILKDKITVHSYFRANTPELAERLLELAVAEGAQVVFTTSPQLSRATLRAAIRHPKVQFLNCSVDVPYSSIRTYYGRIYEAKFITGAIAGAMANNDRIGYIGSYPIFGVPASINAFALGAQMTNPRAKIDLRWSCLEGDPVKDFIEKGYQVISNRDVPTPNGKYLSMCEYGTYFVGEGGVLTPLASPCWLWGNFYLKVLSSMLDGTWEQNKSEKKALNYWWGMDSGVIDVEMARELPESMHYLTNLLRRGLQEGTIDPFARRIIAQDGTVVNDGSRTFTADELLHMDWLNENVVGSIPEFDQLRPISQPMVRELGIYRHRIPRQKEVDAL